MSAPGPWVRGPDDLPRLREALAGARAVALDTESDSLHHHREKVCLIQVATDRGDALLLDPLALRDLAPLGEALAGPAVVKVLHGADYDVTTLKRDFGFRFERLFDTMIAARFLGLPEIGLQAVARVELGVTLSKDSQKDDWSRRPLSPVQERYALDDVRHLVRLYERLAQKLREAGRLAWVEEESAAVAALEPARRGRDSEAWERIKGARRLSPRQQAVLRALAAWREELAEATDVPLYRLASNEALLALAERPPGNPGGLRGVRGVSPRVHAHAAAVVAAVEQALALPADAWPRLPPAPRPPVLPAPVRGRVNALRAWRAKAAERLGLDVSVVLPQRLIDKVAEAAPASLDALRAVDGLRRWRVAALGDEILSALRAAAT